MGAKLSSVVDQSLFDAKLQAMLSMDLSAPRLKWTTAATNTADEGAPPPYEATKLSVTTSTQTYVSGLTLEAERVQHQTTTASLHGQLARLQAEVAAVRAGSRNATPVSRLPSDDIGQQLRDALQVLGKLLLTSDGGIQLTAGQRAQVQRLLTHVT